MVGSRDRRSGVGCLLTTVLGGLLGALFQRRTWDHQHDAQLFEKEIERAADVCYSLSTMLDRRMTSHLRDGSVGRNAAAPILKRGDP
jgi:hypothetical protein